jgi:hypothetical protein
MMESTHSSPFPSARRNRPARGITPARVKPSESQILQKPWLDSYYRVTRNVPQTSCIIRIDQIENACLVS